MENSNNGDAHGGEGLAKVNILSVVAPLAKSSSPTARKLAERIRYYASNPQGEYQDPWENLKPNWRKECGFTKPADFEKTFENIAPRTESEEKAVEKVVHAVRTFKTKKRWLYIWGDVGTIKSHVVKAGVNALLEEGFRVVYHSMEQLVKTAKKSKDKRYDHIANPIEHLMSPDLVVLDEFEKGDWGPEENNGIFSDMYSMIEYRFEQNLPMWIVSNIPLKPEAGQLQLPTERRGLTQLDLFLEPFVDRLGKCFVIHVQGESRRVAA